MDDKEDGFNCRYCDDVLTTVEELERQEIGVHGSLRLCLPAKDVPVQSKG